MAVSPTYPGVYIQELPSAVHPITGVATSICAFVGYTARGIDNRAEQLFSFSDYQRLFGGLASDSELSYAVQQFFLNGGTQAYVVRVPRALAAGASVVFAGLTFTALSSGTWANGELLIDVDTAGLATALPGTVGLTGGSTNVTGSSFTTTVKVGQWLVFASDTTQTAYQIKSIATNGSSLTLVGAGFGGTTIAADTAIVLNDPTAFNLTITNLVDGTVESFPNVSLNSNLTSYVANVVNDPDNGSQLVGVQVTGVLSTTSAPPVTGIVGTALAVPALDTLLGGSVVSPGVTLAHGSDAVNGTFTTAPSLGEWLVFPADPTLTPYQVASITGTGVTISPVFAGTVTTSPAVSATVVSGLTLTNGLATVTGTGFMASPPPLTAGQTVVFGADSTHTFYQILSINSATQLTLTQKYAGTTPAAATTATVVSTLIPSSIDYGVGLTVSSPSPAPSPLPVDIKLFGKSTPIPQTITGLAAQVQKAINAVLAVQLPGASVQCSVTGTPTSPAIRINALLPQSPDAVIVLQAPSAASLLTDASSAIGFPSSLPSGNSNVAHYALGTGNSGWGSETSSTAGSDGTGLPGTGDLIGDPSLFHGIYALLKVEAFDLLCIPDATRSLPGNPAVLDSAVDPNSVYAAAIALCDSARAFLLLDCPPYVNTVSSAIDWKTSGLTVSDANGAAFFPRLRLPDPLNNYQLRTFAPCGVVAGLYARIDSTRGVWKAPAGTEATLSGVQGLVYKLSDAENGVLNPLGLNCFRTFPVYGTVLWGARTLVGADAETSQWKYVPVRRVALFLESSLYQGTQWVVFEPNDEPLWSAIRLNIGSFMQNLFIQGYFQGQTPAEAYFVKCDSETTTQTDIDNGIVNIVVGFAPLLPAEFVIIQIQQMAGQTTS